MANDIVDSDQTNWSVWVQGRRESTTFGVSPAIANAIHDAVGVRLTRIAADAGGLFRAVSGRSIRPSAGW